MQGIRQHARHKSTSIGHKADSMSSRQTDGLMPPQLRSTQWLQEQSTRLFVDLHECHMFLYLDASHAPVQLLAIPYNCKKAQTSSSRDKKSYMHTFCGPRDDSLKASLTSSAKVFFSVWMTRSTTDTLGVGTRRAIPATPMKVCTAPDDNIVRTSQAKGITCTCSGHAHAHAMVQYAIPQSAISRCGVALQSADQYKNNLPCNWPFIRG